MLLLEEQGQAVVEQAAAVEPLAADTPELPAARMAAARAVVAAQPEPTAAQGVAAVEPRGAAVLALVQMRGLAAVALMLARTRELAAAGQAVAAALALEVAELAGTWYSLARWASLSLD